METTDKCPPRKQVLGITDSGETHPFAEMTETGWSLMDSFWLLQLKKESNQEGYHFELKSNKMVCSCLILLLYVLLFKHLEFSRNLHQ